MTHETTITVHGCEGPEDFSDAAPGRYTVREFDAFLSRAQALMSSGGCWKCLLTIEGDEFGLDTAIEIRSTTTLRGALERLRVVYAHVVKTGRFGGRPAPPAFLDAAVEAVASYDAALQAVRGAA